MRFVRRFNECSNFLLERGLDLGSQSAGFNVVLGK
jgi:hypothetical protein